MQRNENYSDSVSHTYESIFDSEKLLELQKLKVMLSESNIAEGIFHQPDPDTIEASTNINPEIYNIVMQYKQKYDLPDELVYIYLHATNIEHDLYVDWKVYMNLKKLNELSSSDRHPNYFDFSLTYAGMGWITVYAWHKVLQKVVKRLDGGSNGYDQEYNYNKYVNNYKFKLSDQYDLHEWMNIVES